MDDYHQFLHRVVSLNKKYDLDICFTINNANMIQPYILCNDLFYWGCADAEDITPDNIQLFEQSIKDSIEADPEFGDIHSGDLFCARIRNLRPQGAAYPLHPKLCALLDQCGKERQVGLGNPYKPGEYQQKQKYETK